ncbi:hypothetical protein AB0M80_21825 [Amycolatopsis sp. NPDC051045]|uniref:hypothetical protein n=1 Tax=Amycolatopsis sp. NPDC051045 TaxID=3156922 RepID=UPI00343E7BAB
MTNHDGGRGMLLFGDDPLYLSHLPTFSSPHNLHVVLEAGLDDVTTKLLRTDRAAHGTGIYTVDPVAFPLADLNPHGSPAMRTSFEGTLARGHVERGGTPIARVITVDIRRVVLFRELDVDAKKPEPGQELRYLCFGRGGRLYLVHELRTRPSFDQVLAVRFVPDTVTTRVRAALADDVTGFRFDVAQQVGFDRDDLVEHRLATADIATGKFDLTPSLSGAHGFNVDVEVERELYLEVEALA